MRSRKSCCCSCSPLPPLTQGKGSPIPLVWLSQGGATHRVPEVASTDSGRPGQPPRQCPFPSVAWGLPIPCTLLCTFPQPLRGEHGGLPGEATWI